MSTIFRKRQGRYKNIGGKVAKLLYDVGIQSIIGFVDFVNFANERCEYVCLLRSSLLEGCCGEWGMRNEEWGMRNEEWGMRNEEWGMRNGEWGMRNEE